MTQRKRRRYNVSARRLRAETTQTRIVEVARREYLARGYALTTISAIAKGANVSPETIYKSFGGKAGLVRAIWSRGLSGRGNVAAPVRADAVVAQARKPREIAAAWGQLAAEVSPLVSPIVLLVREAAAADPELADLLTTIDRQRLNRMRHNARALAARGFLRPGLSANHAADIMWMSVAPEVYELLVVRRGWTPAQFGAHVTSTVLTLMK